MLVNRYDLAHFGSKTSRTPQGFLKAPANFTRAGVLEYQRADGSTVRELRPEEEVFHADSLATLSGAPLVLGHPTAQGGMVTPANAKKLSVGWAGEQTTRQDMIAAGHVTIIDADAIAAAGRKDIREISMGYQCSIDKTPGTHPVHGRYDQIQRNIQYNHVALLDRSDPGRAGPDIALRLDSTDAVSVQESDTLDNSAQNPVQSKTDPSRSPRMDTVQITIAGLQFDVPRQAGAAMLQEMKRHDSNAATITTENEALQGRLDAKEAEVKDLTAKLAEAQDPKRFDSAVADRMALIDRARKVLGDEAEIKGSTREIQEACLRHDNAELDLAGKSDEYVEARFDAALESLPAKQEAKAAASKRRARMDAHNAQTNGAKDRHDSKAARQRMIDRGRNAWKPKTAQA